MSCPDTTQLPVAAALSRSAAHARAAAPVRVIHLGLGNFFRAHQAVYTELAPDAQEWGIAAFAGRDTGIADALAAQDGLYTVTVRSDEEDRCEIIGSLSRVHRGTDHSRLLGYFAAPDVSVVTTTVTEAGYRRGPGGGPDDADPVLRRDIEALRADIRSPVTTVPARLVAGLAARRAADAGPIAMVPCDNLSRNGSEVRRVILGTAGRVLPGLADWIDESVTFVTTVIDRITPRATVADRDLVRERLGLVDWCPVVTEPFAEWVLSGAFPTGRPRWEGAGALFVDDVEPFAWRKLWLLNGAHSLLAYLGSIRGHVSVADAMDDQVCRRWVELWWDDCCRHLRQPPGELAGYRASLVSRFENRSLIHRLDQIAADGSQKIPVRILPVLLEERAAGRACPAATLVIAAWIAHLRGFGASVNDASADVWVPLAGGPVTHAVPRVLQSLSGELADDSDVVAAVTGQVAELVAP